MKKANWRFLTDNYTEEAEILTYKYDLDMNGYLDSDEFKYMLAKYVYELGFNMEILCDLREIKGELLNFFMITDCNGDSHISSMEFIKMMQNVLLLDPQTICKCGNFGQFILDSDTDGNGSLNMEEFMRGVLIGLWEVNYGIDHLKKKKPVAVPKSKKSNSKKPLQKDKTKVNSIDSTKTYFKEILHRANIK